MLAKLIARRPLLQKAMVARMVGLPMRSFAITKYQFDDEDWKRNPF